ncbi:nitroreductase family protein [Enterococcus casseliflavus]|uniref:nitroreductase family protein n=1 Tax=Enterococcus casseliflavus TaxID=37734 RepID=UPI00132FD04A|nr:nitroreductase family protein [Enterococcus casseliflavus]
MKDKIKKILPTSLLKTIHKIKVNKYNNIVFKEDKDRFLKYAVTGKSAPSQENLQSQLMYFTHQLEKGLSRRNFRYGFGRNAITNLAKILDKIDESMPIYNSPFYSNSISALRAYKIKHMEIDKNIPNFDLLSQRILDEVDTTSCETAGIITVNSSEKQATSTSNFYELAMNRFSIRDFKQDSDVEIKDIESAIEISMKSPSVCNRQPSRVKVIQDKKLIEKIINLQGGFGGYDLPNKLLLVTSDLSVYLRVQERNQAYIDGGLFCMSLLLSLEFKQIGACPLSVNIAVEKMDEIRGLLKLEGKEVPIMFIACGIMQDEVKVPKSYRLPSEIVTTYY